MNCFSTTPLVAQVEEYLLLGLVEDGKASMLVSESSQFLGLNTSVELRSVRVWRKTLLYGVVGGSKSMTKAKQGEKKLKLIYELLE